MPGAKFFVPVGFDMNDICIVGSVLVFLGFLLVMTHEQGRLSIKIVNRELLGSNLFIKGGFSDHKAN